MILLNYIDKLVEKVVAYNNSFDILKKILTTLKINR